MSEYLSSQYKRQDRRSVLMRRLLNLKTMSLVIVSLVVFMGVMYIVQTNTIAVSGYQMKELENRFIELKEEEQTLKLQVTQLQSLQNIEQKISGLSMEPITQVEYLSPTASMIATR